MKAALIDRYGSNDVVRVGDLAVPTMGDADLLVRVHAASVNPVDIKTRDGKLKTLLKYRFQNKFQPGWQFGARGFYLIDKALPEATRQDVNTLRRIAFSHLKGAGT